MPIDIRPLHRPIDTNVNTANSTSSDTSATTNRSNTQAHRATTTPASTSNTADDTSNYTHYIEQDVWGRGRVDQLSTDGPHLNADIEFDVNKKGQLSTSIESNRELQTLVQAMLPQRINSVTAQINSPTETQHIIDYPATDGSASTKVVIHSRDDAISIVNAPKTGSQHAPSDLIAQVTRGVHSTGEGKSYRVENGNVYLLDRQQQQWVKPFGNSNIEASQLISSPRHNEVFAINNNNITSVTTGAVIKSDFPAQQLQHITPDGDLVGLSDNRQEVLIGHLHEMSHTERLTLPLHPNEQVIDATIKDDKVYYMTQNKDESGKTISQLYSAPIVADVSDTDNVRFSLQQPSSRIELPQNSSTDNIALKGFHHNSQGELYIRLSDHTGESLAPVTQTAIKLDQAWPLDGVTHIENRAGLPEEVTDEHVKLPKNKQLIRRGEAILYLDPNNSMVHPTNVKAGVQSLSLDGKGETAYALIGGKVASLSIGPHTKQYTVSQNTSNPIAPKDTTSITATKYPGDNIVAFAAANKRLFVQLRENGAMEAVFDGKVKDLNSLARLPDNNTVKQLAFNNEGQLLALTDNGKLFMLDAKSLAGLVDDSSTKDSKNESPKWVEVTPKNDETTSNSETPDKQKATNTALTGTITAIHSGHNIKIEMQSDKGERQPPMMLTPDGELAPYRSEVKTDAFSDFTYRTDQGHVRQQRKRMFGKSPANKQTSTISEKQGLRTRMGNWAAHATDTIRRGPEIINQMTRAKMKGTKASTNVAKAADTIRHDYQSAIDYVRQAPKPQTNFATRIQSLDSHFPGATNSANELLNTLMSELGDSLFQAGVHRDIVSTETGHLQVTNKHVQKEFGGDKDLIQNLKKILSHFDITDQTRINKLLDTFEKSDQGLKDSSPNITQPHSYKSLQITKEHIQLIALKLIELDKAMTQAASGESTSVDLLNTIADIKSTYTDNLVTKTNQLGVTSYRQLVSQENTMQSIAASLDRPSSALSRSLRASCGAANHQSTLEKMKEVINTMPEGSYLILDQDAAIVPKVQFFKALPLPDDVPVGPDAFMQTKGRVALANSILISESAGNLFIVLDNKKKTELSATAGVGLSIGELSPRTQIQDQAQSQTSDQDSPIFRLRPELRFNLWAQGLAKAELTDGSVLNIPPEKRDEFLSLLFGGNAGSNVESMLAMSSTYLENKKTDVNITVGLTGQVALRGTANVDLGIDKINTYLRQQAEVRANLSLIDIDYGDAQRIGRNDVRHRKSDQVLHLIPEFHLQSILRTIGAPEVYVREEPSGFIYDSFVELNTILHRKKIRPQDRPHAGTFNTTGNPLRGSNPLSQGINRLHNSASHIANSVGKAANKAHNASTNNDHFQSFNNAIKGWDNKRASQFDERLRTAKNIQKDDYLDAIQLLASALNTQYPSVANRLMSTHQAVQESSDNTYHMLANTLVHDAMKIVLAQREIATKEPDATRLDENQLQALNSLILLHAKKQAFEENQPMRAKLRHTTRVTNVERLIEPGMINRLANTVGLGSTYDGAPHLARLMQQSGDFKRLIEHDIQQSWRTAPGRIIDYTNSATVRLALHPDIEALVNHLTAQGKLSPQVLDDLQAGKGNRIESVDGEYHVIPDAEAGKHNMIPYEIEFTQEKTRPRDFDLPTPFLAVGTRTNITSSVIDHTVSIDYQAGKKEPVSFSVAQTVTTDHRQKSSNPVQIAADIAKASKLSISAYHST